MGNSQSNSLNRNGGTRFSFGKKKVKSSYESKIETYKQNLPKLSSSEYEQYKKFFQSDLKLLEKEKHSENYKKRIRTEYQKLFEELAKLEEIANGIVEFNRIDKKRDSERKLKTFEKKVTQLENQSKVIKTKEEVDSLREEVMKCSESLNKNKNKMKQDRELVKRLNELLTFLGRNVGKSSTFFEDNRPAIESRPSTSNKKSALLRNQGAVQKTKQLPKLSAQNRDLLDFQNNVQLRKPPKPYNAIKEPGPKKTQKRKLTNPNQIQLEKPAQNQDLIDFQDDALKKPSNLSNATKELDPLKEIEKQLDELQIRLDNFDGDRKSLEFLHLDQDLLNIVQVIKKIDTNDKNRKRLCVAKARDMKKSLYKKIDDMEADYDKKVTLRFEKILKELNAMDVELVGPLDNAKHTYFENVLIDLIREVDAVDSENHPNLLQGKRTTVKKIQEQQKKLDQKMVLLPNKREITLDPEVQLRPKNVKPRLATLINSVDKDPLVLVEKKLAELQFQLQNFDGNQRNSKYQHLDQNLLKVMQDIKNADSSDNRKKQCTAKAMYLRSFFLDKIKIFDADYEKKVTVRFGTIVKELTALDGELVGYLDDAKRTQLNNSLTDWKREVDDVDIDKNSNLLQEKHSLIRKIKEQQKKLDQMKMLPVPENKIEKVGESKRKIPNKSLEITKSIKELDPLMYVEEKLAESQLQLQNIDGNQRSSKYQNLDQNLLKVMQDIKNADSSDNNRKKQSTAKAKYLDKIKKCDADYEKRVSVRFGKITKELTAMDVELVGYLDDAKYTQVENILTDWIRKVDDVDADNYPTLLNEKRSLIRKIKEQRKKLDQMKTLPVPDNKIENVRNSKSKIPNKPLDITKSIKEPDPLIYIEENLTELQKQLNNFDGDRKSVEFLHLDQNFLKVIEDIKKADSSDNNRKKLCLAKVEELRRSLFKKIEQIDAVYEKKVFSRFGQIIKELTAIDVELVGYLDDAKRTEIENILTNCIREVDDVDTEQYPNLLQQKSSLIRKIKEQRKKLNEMKILPIPDNKIENVGESKSKIPNKPLEMTKLIKEPDPLMYVEEKLTELQIQLDNFDGDRKSVVFLHLDQNFLKVVQDIKKVDSSDQVRKRQYAARVKAMRQFLFKKVEEMDADYKKKVILRFRKLMKELTTMDLELVGNLDDAKSTQVENILTEWIREVDDVDTDKYPNLLDEKRSLIRKIKELGKKLENVGESKPKIPNKPLIMTKFIKEPDPLMYVEEKLTELQIQLDNFDGDRKSVEFLHLDQDFLKVVQDIKKADSSDKVRKTQYTARARDMRQYLFKKVEEMDADYQKKVTLRFDKIMKELTIMEVQLVGYLDDAKITQVENILTEWIREVDGVDPEQYPNLLQEKRSLIRKIKELGKKLDQMKTLPVTNNKIEDVRESKPKIPNKALEMTKSIKEPDPLMYVEEKLTELQIQLDNFDGDRKSIEFLHLDQNFLKVVQDIKKADSSDKVRKTQHAARARAMRQLLFKKVEEMDADYQKKVTLRFDKIMKELTIMEVQLVGYLDDAKSTQVENILTEWIREVDDVDAEEYPNLLQEKRSLIRKIKELGKKLDQMKMLPVPDKKRKSETNSLEKIMKQINLIDLQVTDSLDKDKINYFVSQLAEIKILIEVTSSTNEKELLCKRIQDIENKLEQSKIKATTTMKKETNPLEQINENLLKIDKKFNLIPKTNLWSLMNELRIIESQLLAYNPSTEDFHKRKKLISKVAQLKKIFRSNEKINEIEGKIEIFKDDTGDASYFKLNCDIDELSEEISDWSDEVQRNKYLEQINELNSTLRKKALENRSKEKSQEIWKIFEVVNYELDYLEKEINDYKGETDFYYHLVQVLGNITERLDKINTRIEKQYLSEKKRCLTRVKELEEKLQKYHQ